MASSRTNGSNGQVLSIPPRWLKCPRRGNIIADKFIPFKTPLDDRYKSKIPDSDVFTPEMFIALVSGSFKVKLGRWIDLTYTSRFYDKSIVEKKNIQYCKFQCRGHDECPTEDQTRQFISSCDAYIAKNPLDVIAVHCTHGFNRTGFLICAYLIEKLDWSVEAAVNAFANSRPPGIYKESYLRELFRRYGDEEDAPSAPQRPDWCYEADDTDDDGNPIAAAAANSGGGGNHSRPVNNRWKTSTFMEGVGGATTVTDSNKVREVQQKCQRMAKFKQRGFPGSQPVSMDCQNIQLLSVKEYMVSWKADGTRYMLLINGEDDCYFVDRDNTVFKIDGVKFFKRKDFPQHLENTLLDGEMIVDEVNGQKVARYLIYDIITYESAEVGGCDFRRRIYCIDKEIIEPRERAKREGIIDRTREPFGIRKKDFWEIRDTYKIFEQKFQQNLSHEIDGLIFQPVPDPYIAGQCVVTLKWKPPSHNSVDFKLKIVLDDRPGMLRKFIGNLFVGGQDQPFDQMRVTKDLRQYDNKIIECTYDMTGKQWLFMRERTDKSFPNSFKTAIAVCNSIRNPITKEILLEFIHNRSVGPAIVKKPNSGTDSSLMPPPAKMARR
ncbi:mRNA-capping enzyme-like [Oppia nitens]|uniref:mRNA-capping enzyme-like n=1 Tax=Oppia nitens TaxID=1686743 RepID=UPI0023DA6FBE|nr:mRNA-capping enzyme-like [Oppia nitens]